MLKLGSRFFLFYVLTFDFLNLKHASSHLLLLLLPPLLVFQHFLLIVSTHFFELSERPTLGVNVSLVISIDKTCIELLLLSLLLFFVHFVLVQLFVKASYANFFDWASWVERFGHVSLWGNCLIIQVPFQPRNVWCSGSLRVLLSNMRKLSVSFSACRI